MQTQNLTDILRHFPSLPAPLIADQPCEATQAFVLYADKLNFTTLPHGRCCITPWCCSKATGKRNGLALPMN